MKKLIITCMLMVAVFSSFAWTKPAMTKPQDELQPRCSTVAMNGSKPWGDTAKVSYFIDTAGWLTKKTTEPSLTVTSRKSSWTGFEPLPGRILPEEEIRLYPGRVTIEHYAKVPKGFDHLDSNQIKELIAGSAIQYSKKNKTQESKFFNESPVKAFVSFPFLAWSETEQYSLVIQDGKVLPRPLSVRYSNSWWEVGFCQTVSFVVALVIFVAFLWGFTGVHMGARIMLIFLFPGMVLFSGSFGAVGSLFAFWPYFMYLVLFFFIRRLIESLPRGGMIVSPDEV